MQTEKLSVSLPSPLIQFVEQYKNIHQLQSRSLVIEEAIELLRQRDLEQAYQGANSEIDAAWEVTTADGLSDETW